VVWNTWADHHVEGFQAIIDAFNASHPQIKVVQQPQPLADYEAKVMQAVREGAGPDMINTFPTVAANYYDEGMIVNLSEYIDDPQIGIPGFKDLLAPGVYQEITQWDGNVYLVPTSVGGEVFYYNKTLYDRLGLKAPATWKELEENSRIIAADTGKPAFGFDSEIDGFQLLISQNGSEYIDPETMTVKYNNPVAVEQLTWFSDLVKEGVFRLVGEDVYFSNPFGSQAVASYIGSPAGIGFVLSAVDGQFELGVAPIPQGGERKYTSSWGGGYMIFTTTEAKQRAAFEFLKYLLEPEVLGPWDAAFGVVPAYQSAINTPEFQALLETNLAIKASSEQIQYVGYLPAVKGSAAIRQVIGRAVNSAATGVMTPEDALQVAEQEGNAELAANQ
jgi:multiple sugar transport system substrate-binding protein